MLATLADLQCPGRKGHAEAGEEVALIQGQYSGAVTMGTKDTEEYTPLAGAILAYSISFRS